MGRNYAAPFTPTQQKVLAILPKITSVPSIVGSLYVCQDVIRMKNQNRTVYHRIMMLMSFNDFVLAVKMFLSTWPVPKETPGVWGASGSVQTCDATGFLGHGGMLSSAMFNGSLAVYFFVSIVCGWREAAIRKWLEPWLHGVPLAIGWVTATVGLPLELYNSLGFMCFIASNPPGCGSNPFRPCQRGVSADEINTYRMVLLHMWVWAVFVLTTTVMFSIYRSVRHQEAVMESYSFRNGGGGEEMIPQQQPSSGTTLRRTQSSLTNATRKVAVQSFLYIALFFAAWVFPAVNFVIDYRLGVIYFPNMVLTTILMPLQGFFDALIFLRPRVLKHRRSSQSASWRAAVIQAISAHQDDCSGEIMDATNCGGSYSNDNGNRSSSVDLAMAPDGSSYNGGVEQMAPGTPPTTSSPEPDRSKLEVLNDEEGQLIMPMPQTAVSDLGASSLLSDEKEEQGVVAVLKAKASQQQQSPPGIQFNNSEHEIVFLSGAETTESEDVNAFLSNNHDDLSMNDYESNKYNTAEDYDNKSYDINSDSESVGADEGTAEFIGARLFDEHGPLDDNDIR